MHASNVGLHRIVYVSRASSDVTAFDVHGLAGWSSAWNEHNGVTGMLLYDGGRFLQAIEGVPPVIFPLMERIRADSRHSGIELAESLTVTDRLFHGWSMRFRHLGEEPSNMRFLDEVKKAVKAVEDPRVQALFIGFAAIGTRRA